MKPTTRALLAVFVLAAVLRVGAAIVVDGWVAGHGRAFLFADSVSYWDLGADLVAGRPYEVFSRPALRTPVYPMVLATLMQIAGASTLAVRIGQAVLTAVLPLVVFALARHWLDERLSLAAAALTAVHPYCVGSSAFILSEGVFAVLLAGVLVGLAGLGERVRVRLALGAGLLFGAAVLTRPSFLLYVPLWGVLRLAFGPRRKVMLANLALVGAGLVVVLTPWTVRNWRATGHFVPLSSTLGVTLYDGLSPTATGASDQRFTLEARWHGLGDIERDRLWRRLAIEWAWRNPLRVMELGLVKLGRFWSPWPNAAELGPWWVKAGAAAVFVAMAVLVLVGLVRWPAGWRSALFLLGPLLYFCLLHAVFVSSIRYRVPAMPPAAIVAAVGLGATVGALGRSRLKTS